MMKFHHVNNNMSVLVLLSFLPLLFFKSVVQGIQQQHSHDDNDRELFIFGDDTKIVLDDVTIPLTLGTLEAIISVTNATCTNITLNDVNIGYEYSNNILAIDSTINVLSFAADCQFLYSYESTGLGLSGSGEAIMKTSNNTLDTNVAVTTTTINVQDCFADINIDEIIFLTDEPLAFMLQGAISSTPDATSNTPDISTGLAETLCTSFQQPGKIESILGDIGNLTTTITSLSTGNPLQKENSLEVASGAKLVNFDEPDGWISWLLTFALVSEFTQTLSEFDEETGQLKLNQLFENLILDDDGAFDVNITDIDGFTFTGINENGTNSNLQFTQIRVFGLNTFTRFDGFKRIGNYTVQTDLAMDVLDIIIQGTLIVGSVSETVEIIVSVSDIDVSLAVLFAIDEKILEETPMGAFLDFETILACVSSSIVRVSLADSTVRSLRIKPPTSPDLQRINDAGIDLKIVTMFQNVLSPSDVNDISSEERTACTVPYTNPTIPFIDFRDLLLTPEKAIKYGGTGIAPYGQLVSTFRDYVVENLFKKSEQSNELGINEFWIGPGTEAQSGIWGKVEVNDPLTILDFKYVGSKYDSHLSFGYESLTFEHLDSIENPVTLASPLYGKPNELVSHIQMAPFRSGGIFKMDLKAGDLLDKTVYMDATVDIATVAFKLSSIAYIYEESLFQFPIRDIFEPDCWLATIPKPIADGGNATLSLSELELRIGDMNVTFDCLTCTNPAAHDGFASVSSKDQSMNERIAKVLSIIEGQDTILQDRINSWLDGANKRCPHSPVYDPNEEFPFVDPGLVRPSLDKTASSNMIAVLVIAFGSVGLFILISILIRRNLASGFQLWLKTLPLHTVSKIVEDQKKAASIRNNNETPSMYRNSEIGTKSQYAFLITTMLSSFFFIIGFFGPCLELKIFGHLFETSVLVEERTYSMPGIASQLWNDKTYGFAVLTILFGFFWPLASNLAVFWLWFLPSQVLSSSKRGLFLIWIGLVGRIIIALAFVVAIASTSFRIQLQSRVQSFEGEALYDLDLLVFPVYGLYLWAVGQILSQYAIRFFLHNHDVVVARVAHRSLERTLGSTVSDTDASWDPRNSDGEDGRQREDETENNETTDTNDERQHIKSDATPLHETTFGLPFGTYGESLSFCLWTYPVVCSLFALSAVMVAGGCSLPSLSFTTSGIIPVAANVGHATESFEQTYSVFSFSKFFIEEAKFLGEAKTSIGLGLVAIFLVLSVFVIPLMQLSVLILQWFYPLSKKTRKRMVEVYDWMGMLSFTDIYVWTVVLCEILLIRSSEDLLSHYCEAIGAIFSILHNFGFMDLENTYCYAVTGTTEVGSIVLMISVLLLSLLRMFIHGAVEQLLDGSLQNTKSTWLRHASSPKLSTDTGAATEDAIREVDTASHPMQFSHKFRCFLRPTESV